MVFSWILSEMRCLMVIIIYFKSMEIGWPANSNSNRLTRHEFAYLLRLLNSERLRQQYERERERERGMWFDSRILYAWLSIEKLVSLSNSKSIVKQARNHGGGGGILGPCPPPPPPARAQCPPAKNSKLNPILVTLKSYFLVFNTTCKAQLNNKFNQHHFIYRRGYNYFVPTSKASWSYTY